MTILDFFVILMLVCVIAIALTTIVGFVWATIDIIRILKRDDTGVDE